MCITLIALLLRYLSKDGEHKLVCWEDVAANGNLSCRPLCPNGSFGLPGMSECHPLLSCKNIRNDVHVIRLLTSGTVKNVYLAKWKQHEVILSNLSDARLEPDFQHNLHMYKLLGNMDYTVQYLGSCNNTLVTEYFLLGSADQLQTLFQSKLTRYDSLSRRFSLCLSYVTILQYLHAHSRVMCDSNTVLKTLSQYLVHSDLTLRVNDLDALPYANRTRRAACGSPPLYGDLLAPEQRGGTPEQALCDTACDVWKIPDVCLWLLGTTREAESFKFHLFPVHRRCKLHQAEQRPSVGHILRDYRRVWEEWERDL